MKQNISPDLLAENKAKLMAQVDSLAEFEIPEKVAQTDVLRMLKLYQSFHYLISNSEGIEIIKKLNRSISCASQFDGSGTFSDEIHALSMISDFMVDNIDILIEN